MNTKPPVDFLMPIAGPAHFLEESLESIKSQGYDGWRLVAVLDGETGDVEERLRLAMPANRLTIKKLEQNVGIAAALNHGLSAVEGEFVARLDSDDIARKDRLEDQLSAARCWGTVVTGSSATLIDEESNCLGRLDLPSGPDIRGRLLSRNQVVHSSAFIDAEVLKLAGGYNARCYLREDYELWLRLGTFGPIGNVGKELVSYRISSGQSSARVAPPSALAYVRAAHSDLTVALGGTVLSSVVRQTIWRAAQMKVVQSRRRRARAAVLTRHDVV